ncbi:MAG: hypothetical protein MJB14_03680 [Spirochaetes bacterium]|nr:hypothetical protein [Spirochaetota bacterium]
MKKILFYHYISFFLGFFLFSQTQIHQNYIVLYSEGPFGQHYTYEDDFTVTTYSEADAVRLAKKDTLEYLSAIIYGYRFDYQIENKFINRSSRFHVQLISQINEADNNLTLRQLEKEENTYRFQALYQLRNDHKQFIKGIQALSAQYSGGQAIGTEGLAWDQRTVVFHKALQEAILYKARKKIKSRPLNIKGKVFLKETPLFFIVEGNWRVVVKVNVIIEKVTYQHSF